jgi:hypothetical protein
MGTRRSGRAGMRRTRFLKRHGWRFRIGRRCCSPEPLRSSETHQRWLGMEPRSAAIKSRTLCGPKIGPGAWPARSTRRLSSPRVAPATPLKLWPQHSPARFEAPPMGNRLRCTATSCSPGIRSSARSSGSRHDSAHQARCRSRPAYRPGSGSSSLHGGDRFVREGVSLGVNFLSLLRLLA